MSTLRFNDLRVANIERLPEFKNSKGLPAHTEADGSDWTVLEWCGAACGEAGEAANIAKKIRRGDLTLDDGKEMLGKELADTVCYLDLIATRMGLSLGDCVRQKFNEVSDRVGSKVKL